MTTYKPSLKGLISSFEINYMLLTRLLGKIDQVDEQRNFSINENLSYLLTIKEKTKYTHVVEFKQFDDKADKVNDSTKSLKSSYHKPCMLIRIYHDARLAEVIESQNIRQIKPRYDYPNSDMHQPDEKQQNHHFLTQWLQLCLALGQTAVNLPKN